MNVLRDRQGVYFARVYNMDTQVFFLRSSRFCGAGIDSVGCCYKLAYVSGNNMQAKKIAACEEEYANR